MAWSAVEGAEPIAIEVPLKKYEIIRRVTAENMSKGHYILCDLGCLPDSENIVDIAEEALSQSDKIGMLRFSPDGAVRVCRKGIIEKWPKKETQNYNHEHEMAYLVEGYLVPLWPTLQYRRMEGYLPS